MTRIKLVAGYAWSREKFNWLEEGGLNDRPIDLLFIGTAAARRDNAFRRLRELSDRYRFLCIYKRANQPLTERNYGSASTEIACALGQRSKIVLNLHRDWLGYFEWSRIVLQGIWQGACVVSDPGLPSPTFESGTHYLEENVQHMTELVNWLLGSKEGREKMELTRTAGYKHATESVSMSVTLSPVLEALEASLLGGRS